jgi:hypothetical protein
MRTTGWWTVALTVAMTLAVGGGVGGLRAETKEEEAARYLKELKSNDPKKKALAAEGIGEIGRIKASLARPAVPLLLEALTDKSAEVRAKAATALGRVDPENKLDVAKKLAALVTNEKEEMKVKQGALAGLSALGSEARPVAKDLADYAKKIEGNDKKFATAIRNTLKNIGGKK